ncbi:MAG: parvulin-like peptidyl-prolyl isomerase [Kiritimatiellia bacterium]
MRHLLLLIALTACNQPPPPLPVPGVINVAGDTLVTVDGHDITQGLVDVGVRPLPQAKKDELLNDPGRKRELLKRMVFAELLYRKAIEAKLHEEKDVTDALALAQREILANIMLEKIGEQATNDAAIQAKYDSMSVQFQRPQAKVQYILMKKQDEANKLVEQLKSGAIDFLEAASTRSQDPAIARHGGDIGWTPRAPTRELKEAWESAPINEIVGPVEGHQGFHILRITGRRDVTPLEDVKDYLSEQVKVEAMKSARREIMNAAEIVWADEAKPVEGADAAAGAAAGGATVDGATVDGAAPDVAAPDGAAPGGAK